jgi:hypothetical protein
MDAGRFPQFAHLYSAYFHEDWRLDDPIADDVVRNYGPEAGLIVQFRCRDQRECHRVCSIQLGASPTCDLRLPTGFNH